MRLCKDCKWAIDIDHARLCKPSMWHWECSHTTGIQPAPPDYVLGLPGEPTRLRCVDARRDPIRCGVTARFWEAKE